MILITSKINPEYSATVYREAQYGGGNGWFLHRTDSDETFSPKELIELGEGTVVDELTPLARKAWMS